jgi:DNA processing protein
MLIRDGARLVRNAADVIEALTPAVTALRSKEGTTPAALPMQDSRSLRETAALHGLILDRLGPSPLAEDQLIRDLDSPAHQVAPALVTLELEGRIQRQPGGLLSRIQ